jgi:hypothetical protein
VRPHLDVGIAGYGFWQVTLDSGADLPDVLRELHVSAYGPGARDRRLHRSRPGAGVDAL